MATERAERRPNTPLFPLSPSSIDMANRSLRYVDRAKEPDEIREYLQTIHDRAPGNLNGFLNRMTLQIPESTVNRALYRYGTALALDCIHLERAQLCLPPVRVRRADVDAYEELRKHFAHEDWYNLDNGTLQRLILAVNSRLESAEPDLRPVMDVYIEAFIEGKTQREMLRWKNAFLLGLSDAYFPMRFAYEWDVATKDER